MKQLDFLNEDSPEREKRKRAFKVPEGYFEDFAGRFMSRLPNEAEVKAAPEEQVEGGSTVRKGRKNFGFTTIKEFYPRLKPYLYLAAVIAGLAFGIKLVEFEQIYLGNKAEVTSSVDEEAVENFVDDYCDYFGVDDSDILALLSEEG